MDNNCLEQVVTAIEASKMWGKDPTLFKKMCRKGAFKQEHYTKAGREWLLLLQPLRELYGEPVRSLEDVRSETNSNSE